MSVETYLASLEALGINLWCEGERLRIKAAPGIVTAEIMSQLTTRKAEVLAHLAGETGPPSTPQGFLTWLSGKGIEVGLDGEKLRIKAQAGLLTPEMKHELAERKPELIAHLIEQRAAANRPPAGDELDTNQRRIWVLQQLAPESFANHVFLTLRLTDLDGERMRAALAKLVGQHPVLCKAVRMEAGKPRLLQVTVALPDFQIDELGAELLDEERLSLLVQQEVAKPFDMSRAPLLRCRGYHWAETQWLLVLTAHHFHVDMPSLSVICSDLIGHYLDQSDCTRLDARYEALLAARDAMVRSDAYKASLSWWSNRLQGWPLVFELPADHRRGSIMSFRGGRKLFRLSQGHEQELRALCAETGVAPEMLVFAAFSTLLHRYSGREHFLVGIPQQSGLRGQFSELVGNFTNTLPVRVDLLGMPSFKDVLARLRAEQEQIQPHLDVLLIHIADELHREPDVCIHPVCQVKFAYQAAPLPAVGLRGSSRVGLGHQTGFFDLSLIVTPGQTHELELIYSVGLFEAVSIERMSGHFTRLLGGCLRFPERPIQAHVLLSDEERLQLVQTWNETSAELPGAASLQELFYGQAQRTPNAVALLGREQRATTYAGLRELVERLTLGLRARGVGEGQLIAIDTAPCLETVALALAVLGAGAAYVPIHWDWPKPRIDFILGDTGAKLYLSASEKSPDLPHGIAQLHIDHLGVATADQALAPAVAATAPAYVLYTPMSTGMPKAVVASHRAVVNRLTHFQRTFPLDAADRLVHHTPLSTGTGSNEVFWPLIAGATLVLPIDSHPLSLIALSHQILEQRATVLHLIPYDLEKLLRESLIEQCDSLRLVLCGAEALPRNLVDLFFEKLPKAELINLYGSTEAGGEIALWRCGRGESRAIVPIGRPIANTRVYVLDDQLCPVPVGVPGVLYAAGAGLASGYLNRPELSRQYFLADPFCADPEARLFKTGDRARYLRDGVLEFLGRADSQVKVHGVRVDLEEIEAAIMTFAGVVACGCVFHRDAFGEPQLVAYYVAEPVLTIAAAVFDEFLERTLPRDIIPTIYVRIDRLPRTSEGRLDRSQLPVPEEFQHQRSTLPRAYSEVERVIARAWRDVLKVEKVGFDDNFFDLGGNSIQLLEVFHRLPELLRRSLAPVHLFEYPTVHELGLFLEREEDETDAATRTELRTYCESLVGQWRQVAGVNLAIVGWAGRFPGADDLDSFWRNLLTGKSSISFLSRDELLEAGVEEEWVDDPYYVGARGLLSDVRGFDSAFFGLTAKEACLTDPQQRLFVECAYTALEQSGVDRTRLGGRIGLIAGCGGSTYFNANILGNPRVVERVDGLDIRAGNGPDALSSRSAQLLGIDGHVLTLQVGDATGVMGLSIAAQLLNSGAQDLILVGAVRLGELRSSGYIRDREGLFSADGHCRPFDRRASGSVPGQGCAVLALKTVTAAIRDGNSMRGVIRGLAHRHHLAKSPHCPDAGIWHEVMVQAHREAHLDPACLVYIETHGSGQPEHDRIELESIQRLLADTHDSCALGALKAHCGDLGPVAALASVIKACMVLSEGQVPPGLVDLEPVVGRLGLSTEAVRLRARQGPHCAGVNAFDQGGTHAHLVIEEAPQIPAAPKQRPWQILTLSAKSPDALDAMTRKLSAFLESHPQVDFTDVCFTLNHSRAAMNHRRMVVAQSVHEAVLELSNHNPERVFTRLVANRDRPVAFMFPGQGVQYQNMGRQLYQVEPVYREVVDRCWELIRRNAPELYENLTWKDRGSRSEKLHQTIVTQPATFITEYALARLLEHWGVTPDYMIGNSLGEYVAATLAGVFSLEDALDLVCTRGRLMQGLPEGRQLAVDLSESEAATMLNSELSIAGVAGPDQTMLAGSKTAIDRLKRELDERGIASFRLFTSHAFHSYMMDPILEPFQAAVARVALNPPSVPFISTITGTWITDEEATSPGYWARQLRRPVRFSQGLEEIMRKNGELILLEVGPDKQLTSIALRHPAKTRNQVVLSTMRQPLEEESDIHHLLNTIGRLWLNGYALDWQGIHSGRRNRSLPLPTYPFQHKPFWLTRPGAWEMGISDGFDEAETDEPALVELESEHQRANVPNDFIHPRDPLETEIAGYWCQTLGLVEIGIYDDFFELGGNSLIGVRLINLLRRKLRVPLANPLLLQKRNIAALADYIREIRNLGSGGGNRASIMVQLQIGERGLTPLFLFHPIEGDVLIYRQLVDYLGPRQPVYAAQARSLVGGPPFSDIPRQARAYLEDLRKIQPQGPYYFCGFSYGGLLAYEISRLLLEANETVELTAMIDTAHPSEIDMHFDSPVEILKFLTGYAIDFPREEYSGLSQEEQIAYAESRVRAANRANLIPPVFGMEMCRTWMGHQEAIHSFKPKPYPGRVLFFNATELMGDATRSGYHPWLLLVQGGFEIHHVPGNHISVMNVPDQVKLIARQLKRALRQIH